MKKLRFIFIFIGFIFIFIGCGSNKVKGTSEQNTEVVFSGNIIDGYVQYATVFVDLNGNDKLDNGEPNTRSNALGHYSIRMKKKYIDDDYRLVAYEGFDTHIRTNFLSILKANPRDHKDNILNLTPLSTLVSQYQIYKKSSLATAKSKVSSFVEINSSSIIKDPIEEFQTNPKLYKQNLKVQKIVESSTKYIFDEISTIRSIGIFNSLAEKIDEGKPLKKIKNIKVVALDNYNWKDVDIELIVREINNNVNNDITSADVDAGADMYKNILEAVNKPKNISNNSPIPLFDKFEMQEDGIFSGDLNATDEDNDTLTYEIVTHPKHGVLVMGEEGNFTYTLISNYNGEDEFIYKVFDGFEYSIHKKVNITIESINDIPIFTNESTLYAYENQNIAGQLTATDGDGDTLSYHIEANSNDDSNKFYIISNSGILTFKHDPDYEDPSQNPIYPEGGTPKREYKLRVSVTDNNQTNFQNLTIKIKDIADVVPIIHDSIGDINENSEAGTIVNGSITILTLGDSPITSMSLSGYGSENFTIDENGTIRVSQVSSLDADTAVANYNNPNARTEYNLTVIAKNSSVTTTGIEQSTPINLKIRINDLPDIKPIINDFNATFAENTDNGTFIGYVGISRVGDRAITSRRLEGTGSGAFHIATDGNLTISDNSTLDYEALMQAGTNQIVFKAYATNEAGESNSSTITITITDIPDVPPTLLNFSGNIDENATIPTIIGQVQFQSQGDTNITSYELNDTSIFDINTTGHIRLLANNTLDFEKQSRYVLEVNATNAGGLTSQAVTVTIDIGDILEENMYLLSVVYSNQNNGIVDDDLVYIYFSVEPDSGTLNLAKDDFTISGNGDFGAISSHNIGFNTSPFLGYKYLLDSTSTAFISNSTKLEIKQYEITDLQNQTPSDYIKTTMIEFINLLRTNQEKCYDKQNISNTWNCNEDRGIGDAKTHTGVDINFTRDSNQIVTDNISGNIWNNEHNKTFNHADASNYCNNLNIDNNTSWSLPTMQELFTIIDKNSTDSTQFYFDEFNNTMKEKYWSKDNRKDETSKYWTVDFNSGLSIGVTGTDNNIKTICIKNKFTFNHNFLRDSESNITLDTTTGLMWEDTPDSANAGNKKDWKSAFDYCEQLSIGSYTDWKVPNINELYSIINTSVTNPSIYQDFINTASFTYWSSSVLVSDDAQRWVIDFNLGDIKHRNNGDETYIRCVRSIE